MSRRLPGQMPRVPERVDMWLRRVTFALLILLGATLLTHTIFNSDIWWQLKTGERILSGNGIPHTDPYTHTVYQAEWIDLHWGFQVLIALAYRMAGAVGLNLYLYVTIGAAMLITALNQYDRRYWSITAIFALFLLLSANTRFLVRPEALTFVFLAVETLLLAHMRDERWNRWLWCIPAMIVVWANVQGLFVLGVVLVCLTTAGEVMRRILPMPLVWAGPEPLPSGQWRRLRYVTVLSLVAGLGTPYGLRGLAFPFTLFTRVGGQQNVYANVIAEFRPTFGGGPLTAPTEMFVLYILLGGAILILAARHLPVGAYLTVAGFGFLAFSARRNVPVALFVLTPLIVGSAQLMLRRSERLALWDLVGIRSWVQTGLGVVVCLTCLWHVREVASDRYYVQDRRGERFGLGLAENIYPGKAVDFLLERQLPGPLFNSMYIGGYAIYRLSPEVLRVSLDSRLEVHTEVTLGSYIAAARGRQELDGLLNLYGANTALITHSSQDVGQLFASLAILRDWQLVYLDPWAAVFVRTRVAVERNLRPVSPPLPPEELVPVSAELDHETPAWAHALTRAVGRLHVGPRFPTEIFNMGTLYLELGRADLASGLLEAGVQQYPDTAHGWYNLGLALEHLRRFVDAETAYREAVRLRPRMASAWVNLGLLARDRDDFASARGAFEHGVQADGNHIAARYNLATVLITDGAYARAYPHLSRLTRQMPEMSLWWYEFGRNCRRIGRFTEGAAALERAVDLDPTSVRYWLELSDLLFAADDVVGGTRALREAFDLAPQEPAVQTRMRSLGAAPAP